MSRQRLRIPFSAKTRWQLIFFFRELQGEHTLSVKSELPNLSSKDWPTFDFLVSL